MRASLLAVLVALVVGLAAGVAFLALREPAELPSDTGDTADTADGPPRDRAVAPDEPAPTDDGPGGGEPEPPPDDGRAAPPARLPDVPIPETAGEPKPGAGMRFAVAPFGEACARVDWTRVGAGCRRAQRRLAETAERIARGGDEPVVAGAVMGEAFNLATVDAMPLLAEAVRLTEDPRAGMMGLVLSLPAWEANAIAATLESWEMPLTEGQATELEPEFSRHAAEWSAARGDVATGSWTLDALVAVTKSRVALQESLERVLTPEQRAALWPQPIAGRVGLDLFSAASLWRDRVVLAPVGPRDDAAAVYSEKVGSAFLLNGADPERVREAVGRWFRARDAGWRNGVQGALSRAGWVSLDELLPAVLAWPELVRTLKADGAFEGPPEVAADRDLATRTVVLPARVTR